MNLEKTTIETERLLVVPISMEHRDFIFEEFNDEVATFMFPKPAEKIAETENFIVQSLQKMKEGIDLQTVITKKDTGEFLGCAGLHAVDQRTPEMGIWIKTSAHGNKYGREALVGIKKWADEQLDYDYIRYPVATQNVASRKIAESLGGSVAKEYDKKMLTGRTHHMVEYWIPRKIRVTSAHNA